MGSSSIKIGFEGDDSGHNWSTGLGDGARGRVAVGGQTGAGGQKNKRCVTLAGGWCRPSGCLAWLWSQLCLTALPSSLSSRPGLSWGCAETERPGSLRRPTAASAWNKSEQKQILLWDAEWVKEASISQGAQELDLVLGTQICYHGASSEPVPAASPQVWLQECLPAPSDPGDRASGSFVKSRVCVKIRVMELSD